MIAVVTGGTGFIGRHLVRRLLADGATVRCLVRATSADVEAGSDRHVVRFDDADTFRQCGALDGVDVVFHLAAATKAHGWGAFHSANVVPVVSLLEALVARRAACRFVFVSSQAAAGPATARDKPTTETDAPRPVEAYGLSKLEAERVVMSYSDRLSTVIVRPCAVFGPGDRDFLALFRLAERGFMLYPGTADHWLSLLAVEDVVDGILAASRVDRHSGRLYFLSSAAAVQWRTLGEHIAAAIGAPVRHLNVFAPVVRTAGVAADMIGRVTRRATIANRSKVALARYPFWVCSGDRARDELGFAVFRSLPDAVRDTYLWYRQSGWMRRSSRTA